MEINEVERRLSEAFEATEAVRFDEVRGDRHGQPATARRLPLLVPLAVASVIGLSIFGATVVSRLWADQTGPAVAATPGPSVTAISPNGSPTAGGNDLLGTSWRLSSLNSGDASIDQLKSTSLTFNPLVLRTSGDVSLGCATSQATVTPDSVSFDVPWVTTLSTGCKSDLSIEQNNWIFNFLQGQLSWTIQGGRLVLANNGNSISFAAG